MIKTLSKIIIKAAIIIVGILGIIFTTFSTSFMSRGSVFLFFTVQSNIAMILMAIVFLINDILIAFKKNGFINQPLLFLKYISTVAVTITFIVFFTMLIPSLPLSYVLSFNNFSLHLIVPVLAIIDFFLFDTEIDLTLLKSLFGVSMPIYYIFFVYIGVHYGFDYNGKGLKFPYFFMDYESNGWFFEKGTMGVIMWVLILSIGIIGLCLLFYLFMRIRKKHVKGE